MFKIITKNRVAILALLFFSVFYLSYTVSNIVFKNMDKYVHKTSENIILSPIPIKNSTIYPVTSYPRITFIPIRKSNNYNTFVPLNTLKLQQTLKPIIKPIVTRVQTFRPTFRPTFTIMPVPTITTFRQTSIPTAIPTFAPTIRPTVIPTVIPTLRPTIETILVTAPPASIIR